MPWNLQYSILVPDYIVRAQFLVYLEKTKTRVDELGKGLIQFHPLEHILFARHPLGCVSKGEIYLTKIQDDVTEIRILLFPGPLRGFAILFPVLFSIFLTLFGHWVTATPLKDVMTGLQSIYICVFGGALLIYLLIKQSILTFFNRLVKEAQKLA